MGGTDTELSTSVVANPGSFWSGANAAKKHA
jgi:hypothetical protein